MTTKGGERKYEVTKAFESVKLETRTREGDGTPVFQVWRQCQVRMT